jgi:hypothetical protein
MALLVATQGAADTAFHLAADEGWGVPTSTRGAFEAAARNEVITLEEAAGIGDVASLRNRLAHGYASVDFARSSPELPEGIRRLEAWADASPAGWRRTRERRQPAWNDADQSEDTQACQYGGGPFQPAETASVRAHSADRTGAHGRRV